MQNIPEKIDSRFRFVLLASHRAEQMMRGAQPKVSAENRKVTRVAMEEIVSDAVTWDYGPEVLPDEPDPLDMIDGDEPVLSTEDAE